MALFKWLGLEGGFLPSKMPESVKWLALGKTKETSRDITSTRLEAREGGALDTRSWLRLSAWWLRLQDKREKEPAKTRVRPAAIWVWWIPDLPRGLEMRKKVETGDSWVGRVVEWNLGPGTLPGVYETGLWRRF